MTTNTTTTKKPALWAGQRITTIHGEVIRPHFVFNQLKALGWDNDTIRQVVQDLMKRYATTL